MTGSYPATRRNIETKLRPDSCSVDHIVMPSFDDITVEATVSLDFEVFCGRCGAGICNNADTRESRTRRYPQVTIDPCERCLENAQETGEEKAREEMQERIDELERELAEAREHSLA